MTGHELDAHEWMRSLRLEYYRVADIRKLRIGEIFWIAFFDGPGVTSTTPGHCEAYIERVKGGYRFNAIWTLPFGKRTRTHIMTFGAFDLFPGNRIRFRSTIDAEAEPAFRTVCRYTAFIHRHAKAYGIHPIYQPAPYYNHRFWRGETVFKDGCTQHGAEGPEPEGLGAIVKVALTLGILESCEQDS